MLSLLSNRHVWTFRAPPPSVYTKNDEKSATTPNLIFCWGKRIRLHPATLRLRLFVLVRICRSMGYVALADNADDGARDTQQVDCLPFLPGVLQPRRKVSKNVSTPSKAYVSALSVWIIAGIFVCIIAGIFAPRFHPHFSVLFLTREIFYFSQCTHIPDALAYHTSPHTPVNHCPTENNHHKQILLLSAAQVLATLLVVTHVAAMVFASTGGLGE